MTPIEHALSNGSPPIPWLYEYAAEIESEDPASMRTDTGVIARSLASAADLFDLPAVAPGFDTTLEAEAAGASVSTDSDEIRISDGPVDSVDAAIDVDVEGILERECLQVVVDATDRLTATLDETSVLGGVTGPRQLTDSLLTTDESEMAVLEETMFTASDVGRTLANAYLDRGADGLVVLEPKGIQESPEYEDAVLPVTNVCDHYDGTSILVQPTVTERDVELAATYGFDAITGVTEDPTALEAARKHGITLGIGIPVEKFREGAVETFRTEYPDDVLFTSEWALPQDISPETLHELMGSLEE